MNKIKIYTQKDLDNLPDSFEEYTRILLINFNGAIKKAWGNSSVEARGNSSVVARENSSVVALENSSVVAWENSSVVALGNSSVEARGNSSVVARENSSVVALGNSSVEARGNSSVVALENSSVEAWGNSSVVARGNSSVEAWENSSVKCFSSWCKLNAAHQSVIITQGCDPKITKTATVNLVTTKKHIHDTESFCEIYKPTDGKITLFKSVNSDGNVDFHTGKIEYKKGTEVLCPDFDPTPQRQCGGGLHLSPTPKLALSYNKGKLLECLVNVEDIVIYGEDITKVRCRKVFVVREL
jgi:hypothetical protein